MSIFEDQRALMKAFEQTTDVFNLDQVELYEDLINEEIQEFLIAEDEQEKIKEAIDILVVTCGFLISSGVDCDEAWKRVYESNMSKLHDGKLIKREDGKVLKPATYKAPDMSGLIKLG